MADPSTILPAGTPAPDFTLPVTPDQSLSLSDFRGRTVILAFYPNDFSPVCGDQLGLYNEILAEFHKHHAELIGISVDSSWCHAAFSSARKLHFPLLADFEPKGAVAKCYGVYRDHEGTAARALFVIDGEGIIRWSYLSPIGVNPGADGILDALEALDSHAGAGTLRPDVSERDHTIGPADAPITLVEYGDLQCPHCRRAHGVLPRVMRRVGDRMRFVFRHFPLTESHPNALHAAEAAESVAAQAGEKAFWKMHDLLYEHQPEWEDADDDARILELAREAGADPDTVAAALDDEKYEEHVKEDFMSGVRSGVNGTPTFFINGRRFDGDWTSVDTFVAALEAAAG